MGSGAIVVRQVCGLCSIIRLEAVDKLGRRSVEGIDVLIVVAHREEAELVVLITEGSAGQC